MKRKFIFLITLIFALGGVKSSLLNAQENQDPNVVTIEGTSAHIGWPSDTGGPFDPYDYTSCSQSYYTSAEINKPAGSIIGKIAYNVSVAAGSNANRSIKVWLQNTDKNNFGESNTKPGSNATAVLMNNSEYLVYDGKYDVAKTGWIDIDITDFTYDGNNLLVTVYDYTDTQNGDLKFYSFNSFTFNTEATKGYYRSLYRAKNDPTINNASFKESKYTPALKLTFVTEEEGDDSETQTLTAPTVASPVDGATINNTTVDLSWNYGENNTATHYQVLLGTDEQNLSAITDGWVARTELVTGGFATEDVFTVDNLVYGTKYYWRVNVKEGEESTPVEGSVWSFTLPYIFNNEGNWNVETNWNAGTVPGEGAIVTLNANATITAEDNVTVADFVISENTLLTVEGSLTITGKFENTNPLSLIIEDGGQIFQTNDGVQAMFNMGIINPTEWSGDNNADGWQLISSPFTDASVSYFTSTTDEYDLYKFDGNQVSEEWRNHKAQANNGFETEFVPGRAYLASYKTKDVASISGTLCNKTVFNVATTTDNDDATIDYVIGDYQYNNNLKDFHLIGNPFPFDMDMSKLDGMTYNIIEGYAVVNDGAYLYSNFTGTVKAGDGFFIKTNGKNPSLYYSHSSSKSRSEEAASINFIATSENGSDNLIISFSGAENEGFNKLENFNKDIATVFVVKNDTRYGIANFDNDVTMIDVAFEATQMGNYTIAAQPNGKFKSLTLVDRFTGIETDLLVEDYNFTATSNDNYNRFIVKLVNGQQTTDNSHFAYVSGEELILNIEGAVEIIDMMGRIIYANDIIGDNNRIDVSAFNNAAYVVRVINENGVKVQKIIL